MSISLQDVKPALVKRVQEGIRANSTSYSEQLSILDDENTVSANFEISHNPIVNLLDIDVFIEKLYVNVSGESGFVTISFSIIENKFSTKKISLEYWDRNLDGHEEDLEDKLTKEWNDANA